MQLFLYDDLFKVTKGFYSPKTVKLASMNSTTWEKQSKYGRRCPLLTPALIKQTLCLLFGVFVTSGRKEKLSFLGA